VGYAAVIVRTGVVAAVSRAGPLQAARVIAVEGRVLELSEGVDSGIRVAQVAVGPAKGWPAHVVVANVADLREVHRHGEGQAARGRVRARDDVRDTSAVLAEVRRPEPSEPRSARHPRLGHRPACDDDHNNGRAALSGRVVQRLDELQLHPRKGEDAAVRALLLNACLEAANVDDGISGGRRCDGRAKTARV